MAFHPREILELFAESQAVTAWPEQTWAILGQNEVARRRKTEARREQRRLAYAVRDVPRRAQSCGLCGDPAHIASACLEPARTRVEYFAARRARQTQLEAQRRAKRRATEVVCCDS